MNPQLSTLVRVYAHRAAGTRCHREYRWLLYVSIWRGMFSIICDNGKIKQVVVTTPRGLRNPLVITFFASAGEK